MTPQLRNYEEWLARSAARHLSVGLGTPEYAAVQRGEARQFRDEAERAAQVMLGGALSLSQDRTWEAFDAAARGAARVHGGDSARTASVLEGELARAESSLYASMYQAVGDVEQLYRGIVARGGNDPAAIQRELNKELDRSLLRVPGGMRLSAHVAWSERYMEREGYNYGTQAFLPDDHDLVQVSFTGTACPMCARWEHKILSAQGRTQGYPTVGDATADGLFHPNCFHRLYPVERLPDGTVRPVVPVRQQRDKYREEAARRRGALQANVDRWRIREAGAMSPDVRDAARISRETWQTNLRYYERDMQLRPEVYKAPGTAATKEEALRTLDGLGLWNDVEDRVVAEKRLTLEELNSLTRTVVNNQNRWTDGAMLNSITIQPERLPPVAWRGGIDDHNAAVVRLRFSGTRQFEPEIVLAYGENVTDLADPAYLEDRLRRLEAAGQTQSDEYTTSARTLAAIRSGRRDVPDSHTLYTFNDPVEGVVTHELGHVFYFGHEEEFLDIGRRAIAGRFADQQLTGTDDEVSLVAAFAMREHPSMRSLDNYNEYVAECYAWYMQGHTDRIDPDVLEVFRRHITNGP